ncbi:hypothetical protein OH720_10485 [Pseudomonas sp. WJP1]|uniref:dermonecrotic toxin domain-containing protein n=1 Tax=Pseudomonas sp. WJP1 TaxID=2986947 RepID=UPI002349F7BF|nr:DUF6543 domain-containing protein [Pseudomonas sp. WJP1]WCM53412.1 hypothetical protein OH720_10485 [Pseudomonas sp. WJP1]
MPATPSSNPDDILTQLVTGPSIREVASTSIRTALDTEYPQLHIDPNLTMVATPVWTLTDNQVLPGNSRFESLTDALVRLILSGATATYIEGEHFLTRQPGVEPGIKLPVKIDAIGCLLNRLARLFFVSYQEQQLDYWNQTIAPDKPRWHQISEGLHSLWNDGKPDDWDEDQRAMALTVYNYPQQAERQAHDKYQTRACLIDIDELDQQRSEHRQLMDTAVIVGTLGERTLVVTHSITDGFSQYDSLAAFGEALRKRFTSSINARQLQWRLYEPTGNFFEQQACALIALEIQAIGSLSETAISLLTPRIAAAPGHFEKLVQQHPTRFSQVEHQLQDWLLDASTVDLTRYSRHLMDLALLREQHAGKSFNDGIAALREFALKALREQMTKDHPQATLPRLEDIQISSTRPVILGTFAVPGKTETVTLSLVDLALQNLTALPWGNKTVQYRDGSAVASWLTPAYVDSLVSAVNIGETYPKLIKRTLLDDPTEKSRRQQLYADDLRIQLPLQTLQSKIRGEAGIDDLGYRYVVAALQEKAADRYVEGLEIIIRPLAFIPGGRNDGKADEVANMFVIGPRQAEKGPCLLYRPLLDHPLLQYPGEADLLYAIKHSKALRQSVLAWLADDVRFNYSQYVFPGELPSVWTLSQWLVDPASLLGMMGAVTLGSSPMPQPALPALFSANANALITLADRQSVSNAQSRWATLKQAAWMLFNVTLPFLGRTAATAAWIWQIMDDLEQAREAREADDSAHAWTALTDLFLTLGMVLAHHAATRNKPRAPRLETATPALEKPVAATTVTQMPDIVAHHLPDNHPTPLHAFGILSPASLASVLDRLAIAKPAGLENPSNQPGPHRYLSPLAQKWYAQVGQRWFEVWLNDDGDVQIIDTRMTPSRTGPLLIHSAQGQWFVDTRLRLRGGGRSRKALALQNEQRKDRLKLQLTAFESRKTRLTEELDAAQKAVTAPATDVVDPHRQRLIETLDAHLVEFGTFIEQLKAYNSIESIPNYRAVLVDCLDHQLFLTKTWFTQQDRVFGERMRRSLALLDNEPGDGAQTPRQTHQLTSDLTQGFIDKIEFAQARIEELKRLGKEAAEVAREGKEALPRFALKDLKLFQISLAQELCLSDSASVDTAPARQAMTQLVEDTGLTIQSALDLAEQDDALPLPERIDGFSELVEQFAILDLRILDLPGEYPRQLLQPPLDLMRQRIEAFKEHSVKQLTELLHERKSLEPTPGPSRPAPVSKRIIKTRYKGTIVGKPRVRTAADNTEWVDVISPLTNEVTATFHEKTPGVWVKHESAPEQAPAQVRPDLPTSLQKGQMLVDQLPSFIRRTEGHSKVAGRNPTEIEEMFHQHASRLEAAANTIEDALTDNNATDDGQPSAALLAKQLTERATELFEKGRLARIRMTKEQPPTAARVEWLMSKKLITIAKTPDRRRLKGHKNDYLEEYEIREQGTAKVLWYAHFHYSGPDTAPKTYTAAHLKTESQRLLGGALDQRKPVSNNELIAVYRSEISPKLADELFLSINNPRASGS